MEPGSPMVKSIQLSGILSFAPDSPPFELRPLNVLIGPNGGGKTNFLEVFELLRAAPTDLAEAVRGGGGVEEWLWKGPQSNRIARIEAVVDPMPGTIPLLRYALAFTEADGRTRVIDEKIGNDVGYGELGATYYYKFEKGRPKFRSNYAKIIGESSYIKPITNYSVFAESNMITTEQSILSQLKNPEGYFEITMMGRFFSDIVTFRNWQFGVDSMARRYQPIDNAQGRLHSDARNLALVLNRISDGQEEKINEIVNSFLPRFHRMSFEIIGGQIILFMHETGLDKPIPATRLSDGTLRFLALLAVLLTPKPPSLLCIEEPELGLHPDAMSSLAELLVEASQRTQLIVTTHSDTLISALSDEVESVVVCENFGHGTSLRRLDAESLKFWMDKYLLGEIWRMGAIGGNS